MESPIGRPLSRGVAWELTQRISPRQDVRVMGREASGELTRGYLGLHDIDQGVPDVPWAMLLADDAGFFHHLAIDLDAHTPDRAAQAAADCAVVVRLLSQQRIHHVVTASAGIGGGGRHIWIALATPVSAAIARQLAERLALLCPTFDKAPLCNPAQGCVRPVGAPHRNGGSSTLLAGRLSWLVDARTTPEQIGGLLDALDARVERLPSTVRADAAVLANLPRDAAGHPYLPGRRRDLSPATQAACRTQIGADGSASSGLWRLLLGCAAARWKFDELTQLHQVPAMEHARTVATPRGRQPRPARGPESPQAVLRRQWARAVAYVAAVRRPDAAESRWQLAATITGHVRDLQDAADASPGRWTHGRGPSARRVYNVLCRVAVTALTLDVDASLRWLADQCGISHQTAATALAALTDWGLVTQQADAIGTRAASWRLSPNHAIHNQPDPGLTHNVPGGDGGGGTGKGDWLTLRAVLTERCDTVLHDAFTYAGVGLAAGNAWTNSALATPATELQLVSHGIGPSVGSAVLDGVAARLGVTGVLMRRARRHERDRWQFLWWQAERERLRDRHAPPRRAPDGRPWPKYPRAASFAPMHGRAAEYLTRRAAA